MTPKTPERPIFLTAEWKNLLMINYEIEPEVLLPFLPNGCELDQWNGRTYVSIVAFLFKETRVLGLKIPFHVNFEEVNLRFYVRYKAIEGWRRGVVFIKEIVPRWAIATAARLIYNEQYISLPMKHQITPSLPLPTQSPAVAYHWRYNQRWQSASAEAAGGAEPIADGSEEAFITEHYWGYARQRDGTTVEYQVKHPKWQVWQVKNYIFSCDVAAIYGSQFVNPLAQAPTSVFIADGSAVSVHKGQRLSV